MTDEQLLARPVGWWLKEADARLNAGFDRTLEGTEVDRRGWQVLSTLAKRPTSRAELVASLASFDSPELVRGVVEALEERGWVEEDGELLRLTATGAHRQTDLAPLVDRVRQQIKSALPRRLRQPHPTSRPTHRSALISTVRQQAAVPPADPQGTAAVGLPKRAQ